MHLRGVGRRATTAALGLILVVALSTGTASAEELFGYEPTASLSKPPPLTSWLDPAETFGLDEDDLLPVPYFNFATLHDSTVFASGIDQIVVENDPLPAAAARHLRVLQVRNTVEDWKNTVATRIRVLRPDIRDLNEAIDHEEAEEARLIDEIAVLHRAIAEFAVRAFIGEEDLETALSVPGATITETRVLSDEVREAQFDAIAEREVEVAQRQAHRATLEEERRKVRGYIKVLQVRRLDLLDSIAQLNAMSRGTAAAYQQTLHDRLDKMVEGTDIPLVALNAYVIAERILAEEQPACTIEWWMLAGVGKIESLHGWFGKSTLDIDGNSTESILGPALDGRILSGAEFLTAGTPEPEPTDRTETTTVVVAPTAAPEASGGGTSAASPDGATPALGAEEVEVVEVKRLALIADTDNGVLDNDSVYDRAVGPMQFIPQTWRQWETDVNGDGLSDPQNIYDSTAASARYLCRAAGSMGSEAGQLRGYLAYNQDEVYSEAVLKAANGYRRSIAWPERLLGFARPLGIASPENDELARTLTAWNRELDLGDLAEWTPPTVDGFALLH